MPRRPGDFPMEASCPPRCSCVWRRLARKGVAKASGGRQGDLPSPRQVRAGGKSKRAAGPLARAGEKAGILRAGRVRDLRAREGRGRAREKGAARAGNRAYTPAQACPIAAGLQRARGKRGEGEEKRACCRPADLSLLLLLHATTPPRPPPALRPSADSSLSVHQLELALCSSADWRPADRRL